MNTPTIPLTLTEEIDLVLWKLSPGTKCPFCRGPMTEHGYKSASSFLDTNTWYTCDDKGCKFNQLNTPTMSSTPTATQKSAKKKPTKQVRR